MYVGCGAGFGGDRPIAALKLLERVEELNYIVLECLAERTLADRYQVMLSGGKGFDPRGIVVDKYLILMHLVLLLIKAGDTCYLVNCIFGCEFMEYFLHVFNCISSLYMSRIN